MRLLEEPENVLRGLRKAMLFRRETADEAEITYCESTNLELAYFGIHQTSCLICLIVVRRVH